jgi:hypothetical protein
MWVCLCVYSRAGASCVGRPTCVCAGWARPGALRLGGDGGVFLLLWYLVLGEEFGYLSPPKPKILYM